MNEQQPWRIFPAHTPERLRDLKASIEGRGRGLRPH